MTNIDIRELRDALSKHIADVRRGATITVTDRGTPVARISPVGTPTALERLIAEGVVQPPTHRKRPAPDPVVADVSLSEVVLADRRPPVILYLDTSALVPLLVTEPSSPRCRRLWNDAGVVLCSGTSRHRRPSPVPNELVASHLRLVPPACDC